MNKLYQIKVRVGRSLEGGRTRIQPLPLFFWSEEAVLIAAGT
jgi:hypothetical protein